MHATDIGALCEARGWTRARLILELRKAAQTRKTSLPSDDSLRRMIREWANGRRGLSGFYAELLGIVFQTPFHVGMPDDASVEERDHSDLDQSNELAQRLATAANVDRSLVALLEAQTDNFRLLDRRLGARRLLAQTELHVAQITDLLTYSLPGGHRDLLGAAAAEAAALAGWQALDLGNPQKAWEHHETAKTAAKDSGNPSVVAHVTAQQGYALLDLGQSAQAAALIRFARETAGRQVPAILRSWLWAAEAEALAAAGRGSEARHAIDEASRLLPSDCTNPELPFVVLDATHLGRWRGHCLARLGAKEAVDELSAALNRLDPSFTRAAAALHTDLALAYSVRGEHEAARTEAALAAGLATQTASVRQQRRLSRLLASGEERPAR